MRNVATAALLLTVTGCAFSPVNRPNPASLASTYATPRTLPTGKAAAVAALRDALLVEGFKVAVANEQLGIVRSEPRDVPVPAACDCGTWNLEKVSGTARATLVYEVTESDGVSSVAIKPECVTDFAGQNLYGATTRRESYACAPRSRSIEGKVWTTAQRIVATPR